MVNRIQVSKESTSHEFGEDRGKIWSRWKDRIGASQDSKALDIAVKLANERLDEIEEKRERLVKMAKEDGIQIRTSYDP